MQEQPTVIKKCTFEDGSLLTYRHTAAKHKPVFLHSYCLVMIKRVVRFHSTKDVPPPPSFGSVESLYQALWRQNSRAGYVNGYRPLCFPSWNALKDSSWLDANPLHLPLLTSHIISQLQPINVAEDALSQHFQSLSLTPNPKPTTRFSHLPIEILNRITELLDMHSILNFRSCCRALAVSLPPDQRFWCTQLLRGAACGYLWDLDLAQCPREVKRLTSQGRSIVSWDWYGLVGDLRYNALSPECEKEPNDLPGLLNRRRIWKAINSEELLDRRTFPPGERHWRIHYGRARKRAGNGESKSDTENDIDSDEMDLEEEDEHYTPGWQTLQGEQRPEG